MRNDYSLDGRHPAQPRQVHAPRAEHILDHLTHESTDVLPRRRVVEQHLVLHQRVVCLGDPPGVVLVQMHPEDIDEHLIADHQECDDQEGGETLPPDTCPSLSDLMVSLHQRIDAESGQYNHNSGIRPEQCAEICSVVHHRNGDELERRPQDNLTAQIGEADGPRPEHLAHDERQ